MTSRLESADRLVVTTELALLKARYQDLLEAKVLPNLDARQQYLRYLRAAEGEIRRLEDLLR